jgi:hypothetical protein
LQQGQQRPHPRYTACAFGIDRHKILVEETQSSEPDLLLVVTSKSFTAVKHVLQRIFFK